MKISLRSIWEDLRQSYGDLIEPFESWSNADALRQYWRPSDVKVVLLAESHVFTGSDETGIRVQHPDSIDESIPDSFVKLVYCLGYGENELLSQQIKSNSGTPQFWEIFYSCLHRVESNSDFAPILIGGTPSLVNRVRRKLELLHDLKDQGIWLLDASLAALYPKMRLPNGMYQKCLQKSWPYVSEMITAAKPERIIVIGKTVWRTFLRHQTFPSGIPCFLQPQPQARMAKQERMEMFHTYHDLVHGDECSEQGSTENRLTQPVNENKRQVCKGGGAYFEWTLNERHGYYTRGGLSLQKSPISLTLHYQALGSVSKRMVCERKELDLHRLLNEGFIRRDPVGSVGAVVRMRIVHMEDGRFCIQARTGSPEYFLE